MAQPDSYGVSPAGPKSLSQLKGAEDLCRKLESLKRGRQMLEQQWKLNLAFYKGKQYSFFNKSSRRIESLPVDDGEKPRYRIRLVSNQILTGSQSLLSKLTKTKPQLWATPTSGSDADVKAAQVATKLLEYWWYDFSLDDVLEEALLWSIIAGQGYWKITWDPHAGKQMKFLLDPQGQPIVDESLKDLFKAELAQSGVQPQEKVVYMGDVRVEAMSPFDVYLDPTAKVFRDAKYAFCTHSLDPDTIKTRWGVDIKPDAISTSPDSSLPFGNAEDAGDPNVKEVIYGYFLPSAALPQGRYVVFTDKPYQILEDGPWPYPYNELPLVKFPGTRVPGAVYDSSVVEHAIPLQKELNRTLSQIVEYKNLTIKPRVWAPTGSLRTRITNEAGAIYEFNPVAGMKPEVEQLPAMPPYVFEHLQEISARLNSVFSLTEVTEGKLPPNLEAGIAIDLLQEMATDRIEPTIKLIERAMARAGGQMLQLAQQFYIEPRDLKIVGSGGGVRVQKFKGADLSGASVRVDVGSGLPRTRAGRQARIERLIELQVIQPTEAMKHLELADMKSYTEKWASAEDRAYREHEKLNSNQPLNPAALQSAQQAVQQGLNPETGQPLQSPEEGQQEMHKASLEPMISDNHQTHLDIHGSFMETLEFEGLPLEIQESYTTHYQLHWELMLQMRPKPAPVAPRVNLQIKSTTGPTGQSKMLQAAGVDVSPTEASELPLESWVSDSVDKPDAEQEGNNHFQELEASHQAVEQTNQQQEQTNQQQHKSREAAAKADLAEKKLKQSDFKPKPKPKASK